MIDSVPYNGVATGCERGVDQNAHNLVPIIGERQLNVASPGNTKSNAGLGVKGIRCVFFQPEFKRLVLRFFIIFYFAVVIFPLACFKLATSYA